MRAGFTSGTNARGETILLVASFLLAGFSILRSPAATAMIVPMALLLTAWIVWSDIGDYVIPDVPLVALAFLAVPGRIAAPLFEFDAPLAALVFVLDGLVAGGSVLLVREVYFRRRGHDGIGFGDVKLAAVGGLLCGLSGFAASLLIASLAGLVIAGVAGCLKSGEFSRKLPFGAILAPVLLVVWIIRT